MKPEQLQDGALCQLKIGRWDASAKMPKGELGKSIPQEIVRAMQDLVEDRTLLKDLATIKRSAKGLLTRNSLPFPVDGVFWVPKHKIPDLDEKFAEFQKEYAKRRSILCDNLDDMKSSFKAKYPKYYRKGKYPTKAKLVRKFYFRWNFFQFTLPDKEAKVLSPAIYKKEQEKFQGMVKQMEEMTITLVGNMLFKRIQKLAGQCESGKINSGTFESIERFLKRWDDIWKEHVDERKMRSIMISMKKQMKSASVERLKNNDDFREKIGSSLEKTMEKIKAVPDFSLKRSLDI
ncbi:hypothetical protein DRH13_01800 [Candidatus Woesebacteria bacterium]|nr:MAG: hypothetical protein DRH13_01800 [Candidatus Woesebacteria bacterium]